ncbi:MAG: dihydroorotate dehydrogenase [Ruminococcus sp.]|jgi:dihydroorotate dehydrogenase (NAD+) catalytic subunit|nr:dihydroorotate dehydrogenase [Ruminococcus sp.]
MLSTTFLGVNFKNPIIAASGTYGYGREYESIIPLETLGGISVKGTTLLPRSGNKPPRIAETPSGMLNSVGLQNPGVDAFIKNDLPYLRSKDIAVIANISGNTPDEYAELARKLDIPGVDIIEVNISCPNIREGGKSFGADPKAAGAVTAAVKAAAGKPVMVKLTPNVTSIVEIAKAVEAAGADALSLINTLTAMRIDIKTKKPILGNNTGGLSGPAIFPVAVRMVYEASRAVKIPVCGMGGIETPEDAIEIMMAGAACVQIGAAIFRDAYAPKKIVDGLGEYCTENGLKNISEIVGSVKFNERDNQW